MQGKRFTKDELQQRAKFIFGFCLKDGNYSTQESFWKKFTEETGLPEGTIRSWLNRNDMFISIENGRASVYDAYSKRDVTQLHEMFAAIDRHLTKHKMARIVNGKPNKETLRRIKLVKNAESLHDVARGLDSTLYFALQAIEQSKDIAKAAYENKNMYDSLDPRSKQAIRRAIGINDKVTPIRREMPKQAPLPEAEPVANNTNPRTTTTIETLQRIMQVVLQDIPDTLANYSHAIAALEEQVDSYKKERDGWAKQVASNLRELEEMRNKLALLEQEKARSGGKWGVIGSDIRLPHLP